jgi:phage baseplate assembly protein W
MVELQVPEAYAGIDILISNDDIVFDSNNDFKLVYGYENLKQAIQNRFSTSKGLLDNFPYYGSNVGVYLGSRNTDPTYTALKQELFEICTQEPRIEDVSKINIYKINANTIRFDLKVTPISTNNDLNLIWDYFIG